jgi:creatinine amidohydrolase
MQANGRWQDLNTLDFEGIDPEGTVALLPVAAVEAHGPHLPLGTDAIINAGIVARALEHLRDGPRLLVLPAQTVGHSLEHTDYPGTLSASAETLLALWTEIGRSIACAGVRKLVLFNSHGGQQTLVDLAAVRLRAEFGILVVRASTFALGTPPGLFPPQELTQGLHGGEVETSLLMALRPDLVRIDRIQDFKGLPEQAAGDHVLLGVEHPVGIGWMSQDLHPAGVCGNAARADPQRGEQLLDYLADRLAILVREVVAMPLDRLRLTHATR